MQHRRPTTQTLFLLATCLAWQCLALRAEAQSHRGARAGGHHVSRGGQAQAISHRPARHRRAPAPQPRRLRAPSGFGSAANVRPGFYQQMSAPQVPSRSRHHGTSVVPVYVYVEPYYTQPF